MSRSTLALLLAFFLLVAAAAPAQAIRLRYKFRKGEVSTYRTLVAAAAQTETPLASRPMRLQMRVDVISIQRVLSVAPDGTARIESRNLSGTSRVTSMGKTETTQAPPERTVYTLTDRGRVLRYRELPDPKVRAKADRQAREGPNPSPFEESDPFKALYGLNFPDRDLKPGESWSTQSEVEVGPGRTVVIKIASRFLGLVTFRGRRCAKIETAFEMPTEPQEGVPTPPDAEGVSFSQDGRVTGRLTSFFDVAEGREIYTDGSVALVMKMKMSAPADPSGAMETAEMNSVMKMNLRQVFLKSTAPGERPAAGGRRR